MTQAANQSIFLQLEKQGLFGYGSTIPRKNILSAFGHKNLTASQAALMPFKDMRKRLQSDQLKELAITDYIRGELLNVGKYFGKVGNNYRVYLPSENKDVSEKYYASAMKKIDRARRLLENTPQQYQDKTSHDIKMKLVLIEYEATQKQNRL